jgi:hypothetical protein
MQNPKIKIPVEADVWGIVLMGTTATQFNVCDRLTADHRNPFQFPAIKRSVQFTHKANT